MKWLWLWMLVIGYGIWAVVSIIDIIAKVRDWIDKNTKTTESINFPSHIVPSTITKKKWTGQYDFATWCWGELNESSQIWFILTLVVIFVISLGIHVASCNVPPHS